MKPIDRTQKPPIIVEMHEHETPDETEMRFKSVDPEAKKAGWKFATMRESARALTPLD